MQFVSSTKLPSCSVLHSHVHHGDFLDCYTIESNLPPRRAAEIVVSFPGWARALVKLREVVTTPFGLMQTGPETGDKLGDFPVTYETETEILAGFNDKHLDFRVAVLSHDGFIHVSTWVHRHNVGGRLYLALIRPFHDAIVRDALKRVGTAALP